MGEASRRKDLVQDVRKKIGEHAASAVSELRAEFQQLHLEHRSLARELEAFRPALDATKTAAAESRRYTEGVYREVKACSEREENLAGRLAALIEHRDRMERAAAVLVKLQADQARDGLRVLESLLARVEHLERQTLWRRLRDWLRTEAPAGAVGDGV